MNILGLGDHVSCGSALLQDGTFSSVIIDERLIREKMAFGVPRQSIAKVLEESEDNPSFYAVIREYYRLTGLPSIINTSFNMHEEPIVCTPEDAIRAFKLGHLDYLAIGHYLARNPTPIERPQRVPAGRAVAQEY
jgi:predicted NodU family carbamoyl transferase